VLQTDSVAGRKKKSLDYKLTLLIYMYVKKWDIALLFFMIITCILTTLSNNWLITLFHSNYLQRDTSKHTYLEKEKKLYLQTIKSYKRQKD